MKKIKVYILTWKDSVALNKNLESLFAGFSIIPNLTVPVSIEVNVINNHTEFSIDERFKDHVKVIHNVGQPDFATAMLARMWNLALIHGFKDLKNPDADIVITSQDDTVWKQDWITGILRIHEDFSFYAGDAGDMVCSYTPDAVRKIGLWDERFHYGFGEGDYFLRAIRWNGNSSSINDKAHGRVWNEFIQLAERPEPDAGRYSEQSRAHQFRSLSWEVWRYKWRWDILEGKWPGNIKALVDHAEIVPHHILYPYFEMDVEDLKTKGYIVP